MMPHPSAPPSYARGIPDALRGTLCCCHHGRRPGGAHEPSFVVQVGTMRAVACTGAAAAFAAEHGLPFPLGPNRQEVSA